MKLSSKIYDVMKILVIVFNGLAIFFTTLGELFGYHWMFLASGVCAAISGLVAYIMNESSKEFWKDKEIIDKEGTTDGNNSGTEK